MSELPKRYLQLLLGEPVVQGYLLGPVALNLMKAAPLATVERGCWDPSNQENRPLYIHASMTWLLKDALKPPGSISSASALGQWSHWSLEAVPDCQDTIRVVNWSIDFLSGQGIIQWLQEGTMKSPFHHHLLSCWWLFSPFSFSLQHWELYCFVPAS